MSMKKMKNVTAILLVFVLSFSLVGFTNASTPDMQSKVLDQPKVSVSNDDQSQVTQMITADLKGGKVLGYKEGSTYTFRGLRYATADRYEVAKLYDSWDGTMNAQDYKEVCPSGVDHMNTFEFMTRSQCALIPNEDCFFLNVWTQTMAENAKKPVIVFMHGGGYSGGSSNELTYYEGKNISEYGDVVFVSLNHRLNVLGFLDLSAYGDQFKYTPNLGINDLVVGLEWVKENIASFGGDPDNVTIIGQSGGGAKVTELMGVPSASGLFNRVWAMSGFTRNMTQEDSQAQTEKVLAKLGINQNNIEDIKTVPYDKLIAAANEVGCNWSPVIDGDFYPQATFDTETGKVSPIAKNKPLIITSTFSEFSANLPGMSWAYRDGSYETSNIPSIDDTKALEMLTDKYGTNAQAIADEFEKVYPTHALAESLFLDTGRMDYKNVALTFDKDGNAPVYRGVWAYTLPMFGGACSFHTGGDIPFLFHNTDKIGYMIAGDQKNAEHMSDVAAQTLINYARTGNPSTSTLDWKPFSQYQGNTAIFDVELSVKHNPEAKLYSLMQQ